MKKLLFGLSLGLATLATAPAFAKATHHARASMTQTGVNPGYEAYAAAPGYATNSPAVVFDNKVVGRDPDPNVRLQLLRDPGLLAN